MPYRCYWQFCDRPRSLPGRSPPFPRRPWTCWLPAAPHCLWRVVDCDTFAGSLRFGCLTFRRRWKAVAICRHRRRHVDAATAPRRHHSKTRSSIFCAASRNTRAVPPRPLPRPARRPPSLRQRRRPRCHLSSSYLSKTVPHSLPRLQRQQSGCHAQNLLVIARHPVAWIPCTLLPLHLESTQTPAGYLPFPYEHCTAPPPRQSLRRSVRGRLEDDVNCDTPSWRKHPWRGCHDRCAATAGHNRGQDEVDLEGIGPVAWQSS